LATCDYGFIEGLPNSFGKNVIYVVGEKLSKNAHSMDLSHPYSSKNVAQAYYIVFKLHGFPSSIKSDGDVIFISQFWHDFMILKRV